MINGAPSRPITASGSVRTRKKMKSSPQQLKIQDTEYLGQWILDTEDQGLDTGYWSLDTGQKLWIHNTSYWILILNTGYEILGTEFWISHHLDFSPPGFLTT